VTFALLIDPAALVVAAAILMTGAAPPLLAMGAVPVTPVTVAPVPMPSSLSLSADDIEPAALVVLAVMLITGATVGVPDTTTGAVAVTPVTVPLPPPLEIETERSMVMVMPRADVKVMGGLDEARLTVVIKVSSAVLRKGQRRGQHHQCRRSTAWSTNKSLV